MRMRWTILAFAVYLSLLTAALCMTNPFAAAGSYQGVLRRLFEGYVAPAAHFLAFLPLGWWAMAIRVRVSRLARLGLLVSYAFATEAAQGLIPGRTPEWSDVAQNLAGVGVGAIAWLLVRKSARSADA